MREKVYSRKEKLRGERKCEERERYSVERNCKERESTHE
jgi:hypothetical protein